MNRGFSFPRLILRIKICSFWRKFMNEGELETSGQRAVTIKQTQPVFLDGLSWFSLALLEQKTALKGQGSGRSGR